MSERKRVARLDFENAARSPAVWIGVGYAAVAGERPSRAVAASIGALLALFFVSVQWEDIGGRLAALVATGSPSTDGVVDLGVKLGIVADPAWYAYAMRLSPVHAFRANRVHLTQMPKATAAGGTTNHPHASNLFALAVLLGWTAVGALAGYRRFVGVDLN